MNPDIYPTYIYTYIHTHIPTCTYTHKHTNTHTLFQQFLIRFDSSRSTTSWVYTIHSMSGMLVAPIAGALGKMFSYRVVAMVGGLMYLVGACLAAFANNVYQAYLTYGLISGWQTMLTLYSVYKLGLRNIGIRLYSVQCTLYNV